MVVFLYLIVDGYGVWLEFGTELDEGDLRLAIANCDLHIRILEIFHIFSIYSKFQILTNILSLRTTVTCLTPDSA